jgi:hypothetical protein
MIDVPTVTDTGSNYCTMMPNAMSSGYTLAGGNLTTGASAASPASIAFTSIGMVTGKYYWEITVGSINNTNIFPRYGVSLMDTGFDATSYADTNTMEFFATDDGTYGGRIRVYGSTFYGTYAAVAVGAVIGHAYDASTGKIWISKNGVWYTGDPSTNTSPWATLTNFIGYTVYPSVAERSSSSNVNFGQRPFAYSVPTGYSTLNTYNLPTPSIVIGAAHMAATAYAGDGAATKAISNTVNSTSFQPDFVWLKNRTLAYSHLLYDSVRGVGSGKALSSDNTVAEGGAGISDNATNGFVSALDTGGFTVTKGTGGSYTNISGSSFIGWQWKGSGTTVSNTSGSITSTVCVNATAGFSIAGYTGNGTNGATIGHSLGVAPSMVIFSDRTGGNDHAVYHISNGNTGLIRLNITNASVVSTSFLNSTSPSSSVITLGTLVDVNQSTHTYVAYSFAPISGYSAFGSYVGNGSADGTFVYCGFRPRWILMKNITNVAQWFIWDTSRNTYNMLTNAELLANTAGTEGAGAWGNQLDILSNGFKFRGVDANNFNASANTYIYAAFAESPFKNSLAR